MRESTRGNVETRFASIRVPLGISSEMVIGAPNVASDKDRLPVLNRDLGRPLLRLSFVVCIVSIQGISASPQECESQESNDENAERSDGYMSWVASAM